jgi:hypothetical protein
MWAYVGVGTCGVAWMDEPVGGKMWSDWFGQGMRGGAMHWPGAGCQSSCQSVDRHENRTGWRKGSWGLTRGTAAYACFNCMSVFYYTTFTTVQNYLQPSIAVVCVSQRIWWNDQKGNIFPYAVSRLHDLLQKFSCLQFLPVHKGHEIWWPRRPGLWTNISEVVFAVGGSKCEGCS